MKQFDLLSIQFTACGLPNELNTFYYGLRCIVGIIGAKVLNISQLKSSERRLSSKIH